MDIWQDNLYIFSGEVRARIPVDNHVHILNVKSGIWSMVNAAAAGKHVHQNKLSHNNSILFLAG